MKVIKNYLYNAGYQILLMLAPVITTPYVSRVLGAHNNGINTYTNGWVTFFYLVGQLGIALYGNREIAYHRDNKYDRSKIFWEIISLQIMTSSLSLIAYLIAVMLFSSAFRVYFLLAGVLDCCLWAGHLLVFHGDGGLQKNRHAKHDRQVDLDCADFYPGTE